MAAHRYWRVLILKNDNQVTHVGASEVEFRTAVGGSDVTGSGTASASSTSGGDAASNAFDNNASTNWSSNGFAFGAEWLKYDFGVGNSYDIIEVAWTTRSADQDGPVTFFLQYSDDDSVWTTSIAFFNQTEFTAANEQHVFNAVSSGAISADVFPPKMTASSTPSPYVASASTEFSGSYPAWEAFDYNYNEEWFANTNTGWLKLDLGAGNGQLVTSVGLQNFQAANRMPRDFTIQGSNNDTDWTTLATVTGQTAWQNVEIRQFTLSPTGTYRYYKLDITLNNGDGLCGLDAFYLFVADTTNTIAIGSTAITVTGKALSLLISNTILKASLTITGKPLSLKGILIPSSSITVTGKALVTHISHLVSIAAGSIVVNGKKLWLKVISPAPEFDSTDPTDSIEYGAGHLPCGHWHLDEIHDPIWDFTEQVELPVPYHEDPTEPKICGHWHKQGGFWAVEDICIKYVDEEVVSMTNNGPGLNASSEVMLYGTDEFLYLSDGATGTLKKIDPDDLATIVSTTFPIADVDKFYQIVEFDGLIYALIGRDGYDGRWIQKITMPVTTEAFTLVDPPLYAGTVMYGSPDEQIYGCLSDTTGFEEFYPSAGDWESSWELLPSDYSYYVRDYNAGGVDHLSGSQILNFQIIPTVGYIFNHVSSSAISFEFGSYVSKWSFTGQRIYFWNTRNHFGNSEIVKNQLNDQYALVRHAAGFSGNELKVYNSDAETYVANHIETQYNYLGAVSDAGIYYQGLKWWFPNNTIYHAHNEWPSLNGRILALNYSTGQVVHQYARRESIQSFVILGNYVYVWWAHDAAFAPTNSASFITKLTLDLEVVCIEHCKGNFSFSSFKYEESGGALVSDNYRYIYNYSNDRLYKYNTTPPQEITVGTSEGHNPVWPFEKQDNKL